MPFNERTTLDNNKIMHLFYPFPLFVRSDIKAHKMYEMCLTLNILDLTNFHLFFVSLISLRYARWNVFLRLFGRLGKYLHAQPTQNEATTLPTTINLKPIANGTFFVFLHKNLISFEYSATCLILLLNNDDILRSF